MASCDDSDWQRCGDKRAFADIGLEGENKRKLVYGHFAYPDFQWESENKTPVAMLVAPGFFVTSRGAVSRHTAN